MVLGEGDEALDRVGAEHRHKRPRLRGAREQSARLGHGLLRLVGRGQEIAVQRACVVVATHEHVGGGEMDTSRRRMVARLVDGPIEQGQGFRLAGSVLLCFEQGGCELETQRTGGLIEGVHLVQRLLGCHPGPVDPSRPHCDRRNGSVPPDGRHRVQRAPGRRHHAVPPSPTPAP